MFYSISEGTCNVLMGMLNPDHSCPRSVLINIAASSRHQRCIVCSEAIEHFVTALNLQRNSRGPLAGQKAVMSDNIWSTMRITIALLGRTQDLCDACDARDLDRFNREFNVE